MVCNRSERMISVMSRCSRMFICLLLVLMTVLAVAPMQAFAAGDTDIVIDVTYSQADARGMLATINDFRTDSNGNAWYWNEGNSSKTYFNTEGNKVLGELRYDFELEKIAIKRAAEIALSFSHTRPNGTDYSTLFPSDYTAYGENIAAGQLTAEEVFRDWQETNKKYDGQGHRRNMLHEPFNAIGIAHVIVGGKNYWVQEFGRTDSNTSSTTCRTDTETVTVSVDNGALEFVKSYAEPDPLKIEVTNTAKVPKIIHEYKITNHWPTGFVVCSTPNVTWSSKNEDIASVSSDGTITANKVGKTTLIASADGYNTRITVEVTPLTLASSTVTLEYTEKDYTGTAYEPKVLSVVLDGKTLSPETDYTVTYRDNKNPGTGKVIITGKGTYAGTKVVEFTINECEHELGESVKTKDTSCKEPGEMTAECSKCDYKKIDYIAALPHTPGDEATCGSAQICTVCKSVIVAATGNHVDENDDDKCDVCKGSMTAPTEPSSSTSSSGTSTKKTTAKNSKGDDDDSETPETGDNTDYSPIILIFVSSAFIALCLIFKDKVMNSAAKRNGAN